MNMLAQLPASLWNDETAAHLLNRAMCGATPAEIESARKKGLVPMVRELVDVRADAGNVPPPAWAKPRNIRAARMALKAAKERGENFRETARQFRMMEGDEILDLRRWWLERMMNSPAPLLEKMTLFWHGHFATSVQKVKDGYWMWLQNDTLRRNALGNFATLVKAISRDPAMMIYLDLQQNREARPNENWARELMELFTVGIGNYTEDDIRAAARAFTGYRIDMTTQQFRFVRMEQDLGTKKFMGHTGPLNGDNVIDILVRQPACSRFIGRKLWRFFVEDEPSQEIVDAIASRIRAHNFEMRSVQRRQLAAQIKRDPIDVSKFVPDQLRDKPHQLVDLLSGRFFRTRLAEKETNAFVQFLESRKPDTSDATMRELVHLMMSTPQFQLA